MLIYLDAGSTWMSWPTWRTRPRPRANRRADNGAANHWPTFFSSQFTAFRYFDEWTRFFKVCLAQAQLTTSNPSFKEPKRVLFLPHCISFFFPQHWMECCIDSVVHHMMIIATIQAHGVSNLTLHITFTTLWNESRWKTRATPIQLADEHSTNFSSPCCTHVTFIVKRDLSPTTTTLKKTWIIN